MTKRIIVMQVQTGWLVSQVFEGDKEETLDFKKEMSKFPFAKALELFPISASWDDVCRFVEEDGVSDVASFQNIIRDVEDAYGYMHQPIELMDKIPFADEIWEVKERKLKLYAKYQLVKVQEDCPVSNIRIPMLKVADADGTSEHIVGTNSHDSLFIDDETGGIHYRSMQNEETTERMLDGKKYDMYAYSFVGKEYEHEPWPLVEFVTPEELLELLVKEMEDQADRKVNLIRLLEEARGKEQNARSVSTKLRKMPELSGFRDKGEMTMKKDSVEIVMEEVSCQKSMYELSASRRRATGEPDTAEQLQGVADIYAGILSLLTGWRPMEDVPDKDMPVYVSCVYASGKKEVREGWFYLPDKFVGTEGYSLEIVGRAWQPRYIPEPFEED